MVGFDPRPVHVRFVMEQWHCDKFFSVYFHFPLSLPFHQRSVLIFICMLLLPEEQTGEAWEPSKENPLSENGARWIENKFHFSVFEGNSSHFLCYAVPAVLSFLLKSVTPICPFAFFSWVPDLGITDALCM